ncbi:MAG: ribosome maturation factor RimM [Hyphomicrobiaceae bacterium]
MAGRPLFVLIGRITGAHGVRGEVVLAARTERPEAIAAYGPLTDASGGRELKIESVRVAGKGIIARIEGVDDRNAAEALKGTDLFVPRDRLPPLGDGEHYASDLIGLEAFDPVGNSLGRIVDVPNYGASDLLEIDPGGGLPSVLVAVTDETVPLMDVAGGRVVVVMPRDAED